MSPSNELTDHTLLPGHLTSARQQAEAGEFGSALASVKEAKSLDPSNVYILAFEKQLELLVRLAQANALTDDQRNDILESIPGIIDRALEARGASTVDAGDHSLPTPEQRQEKAAALEWLKNQYFQHAHEYVKKGQYNHALAEIRRVYIIDPDNKTASEFEHQIKKLSSLNVSTPPARPEARPVTAPRIVPAPPPPPPPPPPARPTHVAALPVSPRVDSFVESPEPDTLPMMAEEWSSPATLRDASADRPHPPAPKGKASTLMVVMILLLIVVIGASIFYFSTRSKRRALNQAPLISSGQAESYSSGTTTAAEQNFVISKDAESGTTQVTPTKEDQPATNQTDNPPVIADKSNKETVTKASSQPEKKQSEPTLSQPVVQSPAVDPASNPLASTQQDAAPVQTRQEEAPAPFTAIEKEPQIVKLEMPRFSEAARMMGLVGEVDVEVQIGPKGNPLQARIKRSTNSALDDALIDAVMRSKFNPAQVNSGPITAWMKIPYHFKAK